MKNIEVTTAHNIIISYALAGLGARIAAYLIDFGVLCAATAVIAFLFHSIAALFGLFLILLWGFYHLTFETYMNGQSPGKRLLGLRVVTLHGTRPTSRELFLRAVFRIVDMTFTSGVWAIFSILSSDKNQRLGDKIAQTVVVNTRSNGLVSLEYLKSIADVDTTFEYPQVARYSDQDMLLIKEVLGRYRRFPNAAHKERVLEIAHKVSEDLHIDLKGKKISDLLNQLIEEYVLLTR